MSELTIIRGMPHLSPGAEAIHVRLVADRSTLMKRRWRGVAEDGREFGFDLDHALEHGGVFFLEANCAYVIEQSPEKVLEIPFHGSEEAGRIAWNLGNLHFPIQVTPHAVRVIEDPAVLQWLEREHRHYHSLSCVFLPLTGSGITITTRTRMDEAAYPWLGRLLQVNDSAFPTGGYAHSYGFERVVALGLVRDVGTLAHFLEEHAWPMLIHFELPVVRFARDAAQAGSTIDLRALDADVDASKTARESREASRTTGRRRLQAFGENEASSILASFAELVEEGRTAGHHAVVFGTGLAEFPVRALLTSWAFQNLAATCLSAPKLLRIGQSATQRVLGQALAEMEQRVTASLSVERDELGWFDPMVEIASMEHEISDERLFIS